MADYTSNITLVNGFSSSALTRMSYHALQGNWFTPPRAQIPAGESDSFILAPVNDVSEGDVTYRTDTGAQFKVYFKCAPATPTTGNTCTVTPASMARVTFNSSGGPLKSTINILEA